MGAGQAARLPEVATATPSPDGLPASLRAHHQLVNKSILLREPAEFTWKNAVSRFETAAEVGHVRKAASGNLADPKVGRQKGPEAVAAPYEPKPEEVTAIASWREQRRQRGSSPRITIEQKKDGPSIAALDHPDPETGTILLMKALGTTSGDFLHSLLTQILQCGQHGSAERGRR